MTFFCFIFSSLGKKMDKKQFLQLANSLFIKATVKAETCEFHIMDQEPNKMLGDQLWRW